MHTGVPEQITSEIDGRYGTILIDPPWRFANRTGNVGREHKRLDRYSTLSFEEIASAPISQLSRSNSHLYLRWPTLLWLALSVS
jgi:N6-adenosine-specific RNA methylase IME4